jgi:hypothetical protein
MTAPRKLLTPQLTIGILIATFGLVFTLDNLGYPIAHGALKYWPVVLILIGVGKLTQARSVPEAIGGSIWGLVGTWILLNKLDVIDLSFTRALRLFWPLILVAIGLSIVWRAVRARSGDMSTLDPNEIIDLTAIVGGVKRVSTAADFKFADATAILGGVHLDLRKATIRKDASVDVFAMWGGVELNVPENWTVNAQVMPIFGGVDDKTRPSTDPSAPRLTVRGTVIFGGVEIKN